LISGDIVYLKNQETNAFLTVSSKELKLENIILELEMDQNLEQIFGTKNNKRVKMVTISQQTQTAHTIFCLDQKMQTFYSIWEIQKIKPFSGLECSYNIGFRIKNIATGLYLTNSFDKKGMGQLGLTSKGGLEESQFKFLPKKRQDLNSEISNSALVRIQNTVKGETNFFQIDQEIEENMKYSAKIDEECLDISRMIWRL